MGPRFQPCDSNLKSSRETGALRVTFQAPINTHNTIIILVRNLQMGDIVLPENTKKPRRVLCRGKVHVIKYIQRCSCSTVPILPASQKHKRTALFLFLSLLEVRLYFKKFQILPQGGRNNQHQEAEVAHGTRKCQDFRREQYQIKLLSGWVH